MNGSYAQHSADTEEYKEGHAVASVLGKGVSNPYESGTKQWLDWGIGYDAWFEEQRAFKELMETIQMGLIMAQSAFDDRFSEIPF